MMARLLLALALLTLSGPAFAFHVGSTFAAAPGAGGAGRIYYVGTPLERGWDCTMCHVDPPGKIRLQVDVEPSSLFEDFRYVPGETYRFTVRLQGEHLGLQAGRSNFNALALAFADPEGIYQGGINGFDPNEFFDGRGAIASAGTRVGATDWTFQWTAPDAGIGPVSLYLGAVDGNGANSDANTTRTDPFGDDVFMAQIDFEEAPTAAAALGLPATARPSKPMLLALALLLSALAFGLSRSPAGETSDLPFRRPS